MKALPFPCIRPVPEHAASMASQSPRALNSRDAIRHLIDDGALVEDRNPGYYLYELAQDGRALSGIIAVCSLDDYARGVIAADKPGCEGVPHGSEDAVRAELEHVRQTGCQTQATVLAYPDQPVLELITGAAKNSATLYALENGTGARQAIWEVTRRKAIDAIHTMLAQITSARVCGGQVQLEVAAQLAREQRQQARQAGTFTGKEPFNYVLAVLVPESQARTLSPGQAELALPLGALFAHRIAK